MSDQDMRREVILREVNQGALAGMDAQISEQAADLIVAALDRFDSWALKQAADELVLAALAAARCISDGEHRAGCVVSDGAKVKERLRVAVMAVRELAAVEGGA